MTHGPQRRGAAVCSPVCASLNGPFTGRRSVAVVPCPSTETREKLAWWLLTRLHHPQPQPGARDLLVDCVRGSPGSRSALLRASRAAIRSCSRPTLRWAIASISAWFHLVLEALLQQLQVARDAGQRGAYLVGDLRDELRLGAVDHHQLLLHVDSESADAGVLLRQLVQCHPQPSDLCRSDVEARASRSPEASRSTISSSEDNGCRIERSPGRLVDSEGTDDPEEQHGQRVDDQKRLQQLPYRPPPAHSPLTSRRTSSASWLRDPRAGMASRRRSAGWAESPVKLRGCGRERPRRERPARED